MSDMPISAPVAVTGEAFASMFVAVGSGAVRRVAVVPGPADTERWLVEAKSGTSDLVFPQLTAKLPRPLLDEFISAHHLSDSLAAIDAAATELFGSTAQTAHALVSNEDIGGDVVRVDVRAYGFARDAFRKARNAFDAALQKSSADRAFDRIVLVVSRGD